MVEPNQFFVADLINVPSVRLSDSGLGANQGQGRVDLVDVPDLGAYDVVRAREGRNRSLHLQHPLRRHHNRPQIKTSRTRRDQEGDHSYRIRVREGELIEIRAHARLNFGF